MLKVEHCYLLINLFSLNKAGSPQTLGYNLLKEKRTALGGKWKLLPLDHNNQLNNKLLENQENSQLFSIPRSPRRKFN